MRNMSFMLTTEQMRNKTKTVTRRLGWKNLKPGDIVNACVKCMGLKKGEKIEVIGQIRILSNRPMELRAHINKHDCRREGFPDMYPADFVAMFCKAMKCQSDQQVNRIEFEHLPK